MRRYDRPADAGQNIMGIGPELYVESVQKNVKMPAGGQSVYAGAETDVVNF